MLFWREFHSLDVIGINELLYCTVLHLGIWRLCTERRFRWLTWWTVGGTKVERYWGLFRLGRKSGITIGLDQSRDYRTLHYVRSVSFMYGSLLRRLWDEKTRWLTTFMFLWNLLAIYLCWDCITIRNDIYDFL